MALRLYYHPLSSYCWKVLTALYETGVVFEPVLLDLGDPAARAAFLALWPVGKMPVLMDGERMVPETSIIIEYLDRRHPGGAPLIPADPDEARRTRLADRFYDLYVMGPMQAIVGDRLRPIEAKDPTGVAQARERLAVAYGMIEADMAAKTWAMGEAFTIADCAAAPALHYANLVAPFEADHPNAAAYLGRLSRRASFARVLREAEPYRAMFPSE